VPQLVAETHHRQPEPQQIVHWTNDASDLAQRLARQLDHDDIDMVYARACKALFWIRLYGVVTDVRGFFVGRQRILTHDPTIMRVIDAIDQVLAALTMPERAFVEFKRTSESHPVQDGYSPMTASPSQLVPNTSRVDAAKLAGEYLNGLVTVYAETAGFHAAFGIARKVAPPLALVRDDVAAWHAVAKRFTVVQLNGGKIG
jgi:hypothetical protein